MKPSISDLIEQGALFVVNHSGGKDSQAMFAKIAALVPNHQLLVIHAVLPEVEWQGVNEHILATIGDAPLISVTAAKTFFDLVENRKMFPSPKHRQCTSDLKRNPIERTIRNFLKSNPHFNGLVVNCMGMRAEESKGRATLETLKLNHRNSKAGRVWYDWLPIHAWRTREVFEAISSAGQTPHWAYAEGMSRLSCCFCIMGSRQDLTTAARLNPALYKRYVEIEKRLSFTLSPSRKTLPEITGVAA